MRKWTEEELPIVELSEDRRSTLIILSKEGSQLLSALLSRAEQRDGELPTEELFDLRNRLDSTVTGAAPRGRTAMAARLRSRQVTPLPLRGKQPLPNELLLPIARRGHDQDCESEFITEAGGWTSCRCEERKERAEFIEADER